MTEPGDKIVRPGPDWFPKTNENEMNGPDLNLWPDKRRANSVHKLYRRMPTRVFRGHSQIFKK